MISLMQNIKTKMIESINYFVLLFVFIAPIKPYLGKKVIILTLFIWLLSVNYKDIIKLFMFSKTLQYIFIFLGYIILSLLWSENYLNGLKWIEKYLIYFFIPILIIVTTKDLSLVRKIIFVFIFAMMINEIMSYGIFFGLIDNIFGFKFEGNAFNPIPFQSSHIPYSVYISFAILISLYKILFLKTNKYFYVLSVVFIITMLINLFLSIGRTGQFTLIMSILSLLIIYQKKNIKLILITITAMIGIVILAYNLSNTFNVRINEGKNDFKNIFLKDNLSNSFGVRIGSYVILPKLLNETNLLIGAGVGDVQDLVLKNTKEYFGEDSMFAVQKGLLHNTFLEILITYGIIGFFIFIMIFYKLLKINIIDKELIYLRYILVLFIIFSGISANLFTFREFMFLYAIFISIIIKEELSKIKHNDLIQTTHL
jgi:O-antigen ligase